MKPIFRIYKTISRLIRKCLETFPTNNFTINDLLSFPNMVKNAENSKEYWCISFDVQSLFTRILAECSRWIESICRVSTLKTLLLELNQECTFSVNFYLIKQVDENTRDGPLSAAFFKHINV